MGWSHTLVLWKMAVTFLELWPPSPALLVLASVVLRLEHAQEKMMVLKWEPLVPVQHVLVSIL